jgi:NTE family protein
MLIHAISAENGFKDLNASSKLNAEWDFLVHLNAVGRNVADQWLGTNVEAIGHYSTLDIHALTH